MPHHQGYVCIRAQRCFQGGKCGCNRSANPIPDGEDREIMKEILCRNFKALMKILVFNLSYMGGPQEGFDGEVTSFHLYFSRITLAGM